MKHLNFYGEYTPALVILAYVYVNWLLLLFLLAVNCEMRGE